MPVAAIAAVGAVGSAVVSSNGARSAAKTQRQGQEAAAQTAKDNLTDVKSQLQPYMDIGKTALPQLQEFTQGGPNTDAMLAALEKYPGYQFAIGQARNAIDANAAKMGSRVSGNQIQGAVDYSIGASGSLFDKYLGQLQSNATIGQNAVESYTRAATGTSDAVRSAQIGAANAKAGGQIGNANAWGSAIQGVTGAIGDYAGRTPDSWLNKPISDLWSSSAAESSVKEAGAIPTKNPKV